MRVNVLDMILYLFETYAADPMPTQHKHEMITRELEYAGFSQEQIQWAVDWLQFIVNRKYEVYSAEFKENKSARIFNEIEESKISAECRGYLYSLEQMQLLDARTREIVIDGLLTLNLEVVDVEVVKQVIQMIIANKKQYQALATWLKADQIKAKEVH